MIENIKSQMRKGILEYCILSIIAKQEAYPSDIIEILKQAKLWVAEGTLYPLLTRLKNNGLLSYRWEESPSGHPRKYFYLTDEGRDLLAQLQDEWKSIRLSIEHISEKS